MKYIIEYQPVGQESLHPWVDTDDGNKTTKDVQSLNGSTLYQFRVRAFSKVPGEWSKFVQAMTQRDGGFRLKTSSRSEFGSCIGVNALAEFHLVSPNRWICDSFFVAMKASKTRPRPRRAWLGGPQGTATSCWWRWLAR